MVEWCFLFTSASFTKYHFASVLHQICHFFWLNTVINFKSRQKDCTYNLNRSSNFINMFISCDISGRRIWCSYHPVVFKPNGKNFQWNIYWTEAERVIVLYKETGV